MIDLDDLDRQSVDPAVALRERRRSSAYYGGAIGRDGGRACCIRGPERAVRQQNGQESQIKILNPMIIITSAYVPFTRLQCIGP